MNIEIKKVCIDEKEILRNLMEKYDYEFSQYEDKDVNNFGLYGYEYIDHYFTEENRFPYFIKVDTKLAGLIMVCNYKDIDFGTEYSMSEFFVMYKYKRQGIGKYSVNYIFNQFKGKWQITYAQKNKPAMEFWNKIVNIYTNGNYKKIENFKKYDDDLIRDILIFEIK